MAPAAAPPIEQVKLQSGSEAHKRAFCHMLLDTHDPYEPALIDWPALSPDALTRLTSLPIWNIAVQTECRASINVASYAEIVDDLLLRKAIELNAFEEARHKRLLAHMVAFYGIRLDPEPEYRAPRDREWAFMDTGFSECIDSFFAFGLFALAKRSGFFPPSLVTAFEPVIQEECRHILFFVNWVAWQRRSLPLWRRTIFAARVLALWIVQIWDRIKIAKRLGGKADDNFTLTGSRAIAVDIAPRDLLDLCLAENERRMSALDPRLKRPGIIPKLVRLVRPFLRSRVAPTVDA